MPAPIYISVDGVSFSYPIVRVLTDVSLTVPADHVSGLIGENGAGKSTLLSLIIGELKPDQGHIHIPERTAFIAQETSLPFDSPVSLLIDAAVAEVRDTEQAITDLATRMGDGEDVAQAYDEALSRASELGVWELDARIAEVLAGLGLADVDTHTPIRELSGGQRRRFALAAMLLRPADALVLDEPTNHLDDSAVDFLIGELTSFNGPVLIASHDRYFLDAVCTDLIDLDPALGPEGGQGEDLHQATQFSGGFSDYLAERERRRTRWSQLYVAQESQRESLEKAAGTTEEDIFHSSVSKSESKITAKFYADRAAKTQGNRVRSARNRLDELERRQIPAPPKPLEFQGIPDPERGAIGEFMDVRDIAVAGRLAPLTFRINPGDHILVEGPNGAGKSTLLSVLEQELAPTQGELVVPEGLRVKRLRQDDDWTPAQLERPASKVFDDLIGRSDVPNLTDMGLLTPTNAAAPLGSLSLGQRRRVALGVILAAPPDLLLLDEPTNHLSLALSEELEAAIEKFPGRLLLASHDRWIRRRWTGKKLVLQG